LSAQKKKKMKSIILLSIILTGAFAGPINTSCTCSASEYVSGTTYSFGQCAQDAYGDVY